MKIQSSEDALRIIKSTGSSGVLIETLLNPHTFRKYVSREPVLRELLDFFGGTEWQREKWFVAGDRLALGLHCEHLAQFKKRFDATRDSRMSAISMEDGVGMSLQIDEPTIKDADWHTSESRCLAVSSTDSSGVTASVHGANWDEILAKIDDLRTLAREAKDREES